MSRTSQTVKIDSFYLKKGPVSLAALGLKELDINMCIKIQNMIRDFNLGVSLAEIIMQSFLIYCRQSNIFKMLFSA